MLNQSYQCPRISIYLIKFFKLSFSSSKAYDLLDNVLNYLFFLYIVSPLCDHWLSMDVIEFYQLCNAFLDSFIIILMRSLSQNMICISIVMVEIILFRFLLVQIILIRLMIRMVVFHLIKCM